MRIEFERITVDMPGHRALDAVSGEFASGTVTAVIGPSGAGKSTLLGVVAGLVEPDSGRVRFDGDDVTRQRPEERGLGVVFQDLRLFNFLSGRDNVAFAPRVAGIADAERRARVDEALAQVQATGFADRPARVLSGGERQRIAIARALAARPRALLLDEPFASLDAELRRGIRDDLREIVRALGLTVVIVTHDRDDAFALASHFVVVRAGCMEQAGEAVELYARPKSEYVATLLGEASFLPIDARDGDTIRIANVTRAATGNGGRALLRPEQLRLAHDGDGWPAQLVEARFSGNGWRAIFDAGALGRIVAQCATAPPSDPIAIVPPEVVHTV
jgi:ABC-type sulfate/molybdate transport systems ATPase subunit